MTKNFHSINKASETSQDQTWTTNQAHRSKHAYTHRQLNVNVHIHSTPHVHCPFMFALTYFISVLTLMKMSTHKNKDVLFYDHCCVDSFCQLLWASIFHQSSSNFHFPRFCPDCVLSIQNVSPLWILQSWTQIIETFNIKHYEVHKC